MAATRAGPVQATPKASTLHRGATLGPGEPMGGVGAPRRRPRPWVASRPPEGLGGPDGREAEVDVARQLGPRLPSLARIMVGPLAKVIPAVVVALERPSPVPLPTVPRKATFDAVGSRAPSLAAW